MYSGEHAQSGGSRLLRGVVAIAIMIVVVLLLSWGLRSFVVQAYQIPSGSMEETIQVGDMVFSEKVSYYSGTPQQGDIVTFEDPEIPGRILIKRVIATGGQTVDLVDGQVYVDGQPLDEPYVNGQPSFPLTTSIDADLSYPYTVPEGMIWVMGDNRTNSQDSRYFGPVDTDAVTGRAMFIYWPLNDFGFLN